MSLKKLFNQMNPKDREEKKIDFTEEKSEEVVSEPTPDEPVRVEEEWVWVTGYKGMGKNMQCRNNFQYEIGKTYDMPEDAVIEECSSGFHMCLELNDVFSYVNIGDNNRFFEVRALVRKSDKDRYQAGVSRNPYGWVYNMTSCTAEPIRHVDKLAAKSIEIVRELTMDEILKPLGYHEWEEAYKKMALAAGVDAAKSTMKIEKLVELGYSLPFAQWLVDNKKYAVAKAVGSQVDLSMDMKCLMIMNG